MEEMLKFIVENLVQNPQAVEVRKEEKEGLVSFILKVDPEDLKIIIGKQGRTIKSLRHLLRLKAIRKGLKADLMLQEN